MNAERGDRVFWEPFCGGLSVSVRLAAHGPGIVSDANPALISMYQAVRDGWVPPEHVTREEYQAARTLPDSDPLKGFIGFGCSFGGKWFGGMARSRGRNYSAESARAISRDVGKIAGSAIECMSFFRLEPPAHPDRDLLRSSLRRDHQVRCYGRVSTRSVLGSGPGLGVARGSRVRV